MSGPERMANNASLALEKVRDVLGSPLDPQNPRWAAIVMNVALTTISQKIKIDENALSQHQERRDAERERALQALVWDLPEKYRPKR